MYAIFDELCKKKGVKPSDVSRATGISTATLTSWKQGKYTPKLDKLQKIADYFGVSVDYLREGKESKQYYLNDETAQYAQDLFDNPELRMLMDASRDLEKGQLVAVANLVKQLKESNPDG